jgi:hypothetical protein
MRWIAALVLAIFLALSAFFIWLYWVGAVIIFEPAVDFATLVVTAAALTLAGVGAFVAGLAWVGFRGITLRSAKLARRKAAVVASAKAEAVAKEVATLVAARIALEVAKVSADAPSARDAQDIAESS